jgi:hypothetical protein
VVASGPDAGGDSVSGIRRVASIYARIGRTYWSWAPVLLLVAVIIFLPLGLLETIPGRLDSDSWEIHSIVAVAALAGAIGLLAATSLIGEVFFSGAVAVALTHPRHEKPPGLREIAGRLNYGRLIAVDLVYVAIVVVGLVLLVVPGALAFVWLGLAGPVVEIEGRGVRGALERSWALVRGRFWTVAAVLIPIELVGDSAAEALTAGVHSLLGHGFVATWLADSVANVLLTPVFAVAAVLLTLDMIAEKDGAGPRLNPSPRPAAATG